MWLFRPKPGEEGAEEIIEDFAGLDPPEDLLNTDDVDFLRARALELQAKLDAMRAAEYREQMRASCAAHEAESTKASSSKDDTIHSVDDVATSATSDRGSEGVMHQAAQAFAHSRGESPTRLIVPHFELEDTPGEEDEDDEDGPQSNSLLEDMYDFSRFAGSSAQSGEDDSVNTSVSLTEELRQAQAREAALLRRMAHLEKQVDTQDKKVVAAARAMQRTRSRVQQLTAQLGLKELEGSQLNSEVSQLRSLLVEKEKRLQSALDDAEAAIKDAESCSAAAFAALQAQQPQEAPNGMLPGIDDPPRLVPSPDSAGRATAVDDVQMLQLAKITEELTDALEVARDAEDRALREARDTAQQLERERLTRVQVEEELLASRETSKAEMAGILAHVAEQERALFWERQRAKEAEERARRVELEDRLGQALKSKGKTLKFPHVEI